MVGDAGFHLFDALVAAWRHLSDLSPVVPGHGRRRGRRSRRNRATARPCGEPRGRRDLAVADLPLPDGGLRLRCRRLHRRRPVVRRPRRLRPPARRGARTRAQGAARLRPQSHVGPAPLVRRQPQRPRSRQTRLVHLARCRSGRRTTQQLDQRLRWLGLGMGRGQRAILPPRFPEGAARPQLAQPGGARGDVRRAALLVRSRGRRLSDRRALAYRQGRGAARQSPQTQPGSPWSESATGCSSSIRPISPRRTIFRPRCARSQVVTTTSC